MLKRVKGWVIDFVGGGFADRIYNGMTARIDRVMDRGRERGIRWLETMLINDRAALANNADAHWLWIWITEIKLEAISWYMDNKLTDQEWQDFQDFLFGKGQALVEKAIDEAT